METQTDVLLTIVAGTLMMLVFILFIIFFGINYNRKFRERENAHKLELKSKELELLKAVINSQEAEREKLAGNLHDEVGPLISALKRRFELYRRKLSKNTLAVDDLDTEDARIDQIVENVRNVSHALSPHFVNKFGLFEALRMYAEKAATPDISVRGELPDGYTMDHQQEGNIYRIILELINNISKHDEATYVQVSWKADPNGLLFTISHDGKGINDAEFNKYLEKSTGLGLASIKSRTILLNADLAFTKNTEQEALVQLSVPLVAAGG